MSGRTAQVYLWNAVRFDDGTAGTDLNGKNVNSAAIDVGDYDLVEIGYVATKTSTAGNLTWLVQVGYGDSAGAPSAWATYDLLKVTGTAEIGGASVTTSATTTGFISIPLSAARWIRVNLAGASATSSAYYTVTAVVFGKTAAR